MSQYLAYHNPLILSIVLRHRAVKFDTLQATETKGLDLETAASQPPLPSKWRGDTASNTAAVW